MSHSTNLFGVISAEVFVRQEWGMGFRIDFKNSLAYLSVAVSRDKYRTDSIYPLFPVLEVHQLKRGLLGNDEVTTRARLE